MINYDQFLALVRARRSIRSFSDRAVTKEDVLRLLEAARWAPSNHNRQPWRYIIVEHRARIAHLAEMVGSALSVKMKMLPEVASGFAGEFVQYATFFSGAAILLVVLHKRPASFAGALLEGVQQPELVSGEPLSAAMSVQNLLLAAHALGLGACVLTAPLLVRDVVAREVNLPPGYDLTCFVALGYPAEEPVPPRRKSIEQIAEFREDGPTGNDR